jgi:DNA-binding YbaB/EbfC family protein
MNMQNLMAQAQRMQRDIQKKQEEINNTEYEGTAQAVKVKINGKKELLDIKIDKSIISDSDDIDALEDMIKIALNMAFEKVNMDVDSKLGVYAKGLNGLM